VPSKYHIPSAPVANRFKAIIRSGVIAWDEGCLKCAKCVKKECVYKVYDKRSLDGKQMLDSLDSVCQDCFRCVQGCPNKLIHKGMNPAYKALGDEYWTPDILSNIWYQAETGRIPVSGAGYGGPFSGPGFDAMWTDMSEIVRPTRDGIHGREYISTLVDLGRKVKFLEFNSQGELRSPTPPLVEIPVPVIFDLLPWSPPRRRIIEAFLQAAATLATFALVPLSEWTPDFEAYTNNTTLYVDRPWDATCDRLIDGLVDRLRLIEIPDAPDVMQLVSRIKEKKETLVVAIRMPFSRAAGERAAELTEQGVEVIHLVADEFGREQGEYPLFIKDRMKEVHLSLVEKGARDQVTLIAGGGIAMAEHMAKLIICGADAVTCDIPLLVAMECRVCRRCKEGIACPVELSEMDPQWGSMRIRNLMAGWHNQLLEILGAMGIREVRRLRGEMGRAMFQEDLEKEFASLGKGAGA